MTSLRFGVVPSVMAAVAGFALLVVACGDPDATMDGWGGGVDTLETGRVVVRNPDKPVEPSAYALRERFRLGSLDGEGPELFAQIRAVEIGAGGELYVLDGQAEEIRVFDSEGTFQRSFGRSGQGPGELNNPAGLALDGKANLWVMNWRNARYSAFDPATGEVVREVRRPLSFAMFPWPGAFVGDGLLVDIGLDHSGDQAIMRLDTAFVPSDTLPLPRANEDDRIIFRRGDVTIASSMEPFAPQPSWAVRPTGGIVVGEGAEYRLHRIGFEGDTSLTIELDRPEIPVTDAERDSALASFREMTEQSFSGARPNRAPRVRDVKPAHGALFVDDEDRTWVRGAVSEGEDETWDLFGPEGRFLGRVRVPVPPSWVRPVVRGNRMALATQAEGFPAVVMYDLIRVDTAETVELPGS